MAPAVAWWVTAAHAASLPTAGRHSGGCRRAALSQLLPAVLGKRIGDRGRGLIGFADGGGRLFGEARRGCACGFARRACMAAAGKQVET